MSKNPLFGLVGYGESDEDSEEELTSTKSVKKMTTKDVSAKSAGIVPAPVPHCPWSACYDDSSGCTYYWNQQTNAVTWEAPPEYLLAVKLAQQHLNTTGSTEVSAEEWQLYQQALADKQKQKVICKPAIVSKPTINKIEKKVLPNKAKNGKSGVKRPNSDEEEPKIELITSYYNSDSESNDELDCPAKTTPVVKALPAVTAVTKKTTEPKNTFVKQKNPNKKQKTKNVEFGPSLPPNQDYTIPIGPMLPPHLLNVDKEESVPDENNKFSPKDEGKNSPSTDNDDIRDEVTLLEQLKNKADLLKKLGGEIPEDLQNIIEEETARIVPLKDTVSENDKTTLDTNIDEWLDEIEKKELPKVISKNKIDMFVEDENESSPLNSNKSSPLRTGDMTPPLQDLKPLFPVDSNEPPKCLFPSVMNNNADNSQDIYETSDKKIINKEIESSGVVITGSVTNEFQKKEKDNYEPEIVNNDLVNNQVVDNEDRKGPVTGETDKKPANVYLMNYSETIENVSKKKRRIDNAVLPEKKVETPLYTTKYSQHIEGFSSERTGLGFNENKEETKSNIKNTINYGNGLMFTKGEVLNEDKKDEALDDLTELVEAKLTFLCQQQLSPITPVQEMLIQLQTLASAFRSGALTAAYWHRWAAAAEAALAQHEASAPPPGWTCTFIRYRHPYQIKYTWNTARHEGADIHLLIGLT